MERLMSDIKKSNQAKKDYLRRYLASEKLERELSDELMQVLMYYAYPKAISYDRASAAPGEPRDLSDFAAKIDRIQTRIIRERNRMLELRMEISERINAVPDETERLLLRLRYIRGLTFEQIGVELGYTWRHTMRIHGNALQHFRMSDD